MPNDFVIVKGKKSNIRDNTLFLFNKGITDIAEIEGLENLTNIKTLRLGDNQIKEIKGLENLEQLQMILLRDNPIKEEEKNLLSQGVQKLVVYCQEKMKG